MHNIDIYLKSGHVIRVKCEKMIVRTTNGECNGYEILASKPRIIHLNPTEIVAVIER